MNNANYLRSSSNELYESHSYVQMEDQVIFERMCYWIKERASCIRSPQSLDEVQLITGLLMLEIDARKAEEAMLESQFALEYTEAAA